jgi:hypothetical protein
VEARNGEKSAQSGEYSGIRQYKKYIRSAMLRCCGSGLSPWLVVEEAAVASDGSQTTVRRVVEDGEEHKEHKRE